MICWFCCWTQLHILTTLCQRKSLVCWWFLWYVMVYDLTFLQPCDSVITWQSGPYLFASSSWCLNTQSAIKILNDNSAPRVEGLMENEKHNLMHAYTSLRKSLSRMNCRWLVPWSSHVSIKLCYKNSVFYTLPRSYQRDLGAFQNSLGNQLGSITAWAQAGDLIS